MCTMNLDKKRHLCMEVLQFVSRCPPKPHAITGVGGLNLEHVIGLGCRAGIKVGDCWIIHGLDEHYPDPGGLCPM